MMDYTETYSRADAICDEMDRQREDSPVVIALRARQDAQRAAARAARAAAPILRTVPSDEDLDFAAALARLEYLG